MNFNLYDALKNNWISTNNSFHIDFDLYSDLNSALTDQNPWQYCNFCDGLQIVVGAFRDCGPGNMAINNWISFSNGINGHFFIS